MLFRSLQVFSFLALVCVIASLLLPSLGGKKLGSRQVYSVTPLASKAVNQPAESTILVARDLAEALPTSAPGSSSSNVYSVNVTGYANQDAGGSALYRSRMLLDQDRAARSSSLAQEYSEEKLGRLNEVATVTPAPAASIVLPPVADSPEIGRAHV